MATQAQRGVVENQQGALLMTDCMHHGWFSRRTIIGKLGLGLGGQVMKGARALVKGVPNGSQKAERVSSDIVKIGGRRETVYYFRYQSSKICVDQVRFAVAKWVALCRWFLTHVQRPRAKFHHLYDYRDNELNSEGFVKPIPQTTLSLVEEYAGHETGSLKSDLDLAKALRLLDRDGKLCGPEILIVDKSDPGSDAEKHLIGPFGENRERKSDGTFSSLDPELYLWYGCVKYSLPQIGSHPLTQAVSVIADVLGRMTEVYMKKQGYNFSLDLMPCIPTSGSFWSQSLEFFTNTTILRLVKGILVNGGEFSVACDTKKRPKGPNEIRVTASYFDRPKYSTLSTLIASSAKEATAKDPRIVVNYSIALVELMRLCCIESKVVGQDAAALQVTIMDPDDQPVATYNPCHLPTLIAAENIPGSGVGVAQAVQGGSQNVVIDGSRLVRHRNKGKSDAKRKGGVLTSESPGAAKKQRATGPAEGSSTSVARGQSSRLERDYGATPSELSDFLSTMHKNKLSANELNAIKLFQTKMKELIQP